MGARASSTSREPEADPWWRPLAAQQHRNADVLPSEEAAALEGPSTESQWHERSAEACMKHMQDMGRIIQHLASENRKLLLTATSSSAPAPLTPGLPGADTQAENNPDMETLRAKVTEYERVIQRLEKDAVEHNKTVEELQASLRATEILRHSAEQTTHELAAQLETLKQEHAISLEQNLTLQHKLSSERQERQMLLEENCRQLREVQKKQSEECDASVAAEICEQEAGELEGACALVGEVPKKNVLSPRAAAELENFQKQLQVKRDARHKALSAISAEMERLRRELNNEREARKNVVKQLEDARNMSSADQASAEVDHLRSRLTSEQEEKVRISKELVQIQRQGNDEIEHVLKELEKEKARSQYTLGENRVMKEQLEEGDQILQQRLEENKELQNKLTSDREKYQQQVLALKDVVAISKEMLAVRENQVTHLKQTLQDIEASVKNKQTCPLTADLRAEYEIQMRNIRELKQIYEEKMHLMDKEKEKLTAQQEELLQKIAEEKENSELLSKKLQEKETAISERNETVSDLQDQLSEALDQSNDLSNELMLINNMFTQILSSDVDLDRLTKLLQENHELITEITTKGECSETATSLPKMLLDLVTQAQEMQETETSPAEGDQEPVGAACSEAPAEGVSDGSGVSLGMQEIASHLPKVWRVLLELISHHVAPSDAGADAEAAAGDSKDSCYKSIDTPNGPRTVISVSQTFLRLRDLILQKKSLQREVTRLKQLNVHLESKLGHQERRLSLVSSELRKTWSVVDRMRVQHQQLHTHEKVLRYELQQKRKMLNELKEELEYCREKWEEARQKNSQSEIEWQKLRQEFAMRKTNSYSPLSNSEESGFSDEKEDDTCESITKPALEFPAKDIQTDKLLGAGSPSPTDDMESASSTSLPDLVSAVKDSDVPAPADAASSDSSGDALAGFEECSTVSLITRLKNELSSFSRNLELITASSDPDQHVRALQSIFDLPAIQIPDHLDPPSSPDSTETDAPGSEATAACAGSLEATEDSHCTVSMTESAVDEMERNLETETETQNEGLSSAQATQNIAEASSEAASADTVSTRGSAAQETRAARMHRLERQCQELFQKVTQHSTQSSASASASSDEPQPSSSGSSGRSLEDVFDARAARLKRLEEQSQQLFQKVTRTTHRRHELASRLEELHEHYGSEESTVEARAATPSPAPTAESSDADCNASPQRSIPPPPMMPATLPPQRLPTELGCSATQRESPPADPAHDET